MIENARQQRLLLLRGCCLQRQRLELFFRAGFQAVLRASFITVQYYEYLSINTYSSSTAVVVHCSEKLESVSMLCVISDFVQRLKFNLRAHCETCDRVIRHSSSFLYFYYYHHHHHHHLNRSSIIERRKPWERKPENQKLETGEQPTNTYYSVSNDRESVYCV
jgi:hypothetical protein